MNSFLITIILLTFFIHVLMFAGLWKLFEKAGKPGWAVLIPIYSAIVMIQIVKKPMIWLLYLLIPVVNIVFAIRLTNLFVKSFGKSGRYTVGCLLFPYIFYPVLAFDRTTAYIYNANNEMNEIGLQA